MKKETGKISVRKWWWLPTILLLIVINYAGSVFHSRIDLTSEKRFTISDPVKKLLRDLKGELSIDVFLSGDLPSGFKKMANSTEDLLREFQEVADGKISINFISPDDEMPGTGKSYGDTLVALGAVPINLTSQVKAGQQSQFVYPTALVNYGDKIVPVHLFSGSKKYISPVELNSAEAQMEYKFAYAIEKIMREHKPLVAYNTGNGEPQDVRVYDLIENILTTDYQWGFVNTAEVPVISDTFDLLVIVKPTKPFSEAQKMRIDQYVMRGGKVLWLLDRLEAEMDSLQLKSQVVAYDRNLNLEDLLFRWGVRINPDLLMDLQCDFLPVDVNGNGQFEFFRWNYFPLFESPSNHVINKNLGLISGRFVNTIDTVGSEGVQKTILLASSGNSRTISAPALISPEENRNLPEDEAFRKKSLPTAVLLNGNFRSLYANRMPAALQDSFASYGQPYQPNVTTPNKMIVISDADIAFNSTSEGEPLLMGVNKFTIGSQYELRVANHEFIQNCIEYLANSSTLTEAKSKEYVLRVLDKKKVDAERRKWEIINIVIPILLIVLFGVSYQWWRKRKYKN